MRNRNLHITVEIAIFTALTLVLDQFAVFKMPQGGSISLGMLPILVIALRHGTGVGLVTGMLTGIVNFLFGGYFLNVVQIILDYPVAFAVLGLAGVVADRFQQQLQEGQLTKAVVSASLGTLFGSIAVWIAHTISGIAFFGQFAPHGQAIWFYSMTYNAAYVIPKMTLTLVVLILLILKAPRIMRV